jgi:hypothetical protein
MALTPATLAGHGFRNEAILASKRRDFGVGFDNHRREWKDLWWSMAKLMEGFKDGKPELGRRTFLVPETVAEVLALLYHEQTGIVGGLPVGPVTTEAGGMVGIRMYPDQDPGVLEETRKYFEKLAEQFEGEMPRA